MPIYEQIFADKHNWLVTTLPVITSVIKLTHCWSTIACSDWHSITGWTSLSAKSSMTALCSPKHQHGLSDFSTRNTANKSWFRHSCVCAHCTVWTNLNRSCRCFTRLSACFSTSLTFCCSSSACDTTFSESSHPPVQYKCRIWHAKSMESSVWPA